MRRLNLLAATLAVLAWSFNAIRAITADSLNTAPMLAAVSLLVVGLVALLGALDDVRRAAHDSVRQA